MKYQLLFESLAHHISLDSTEIQTIQSLIETTTFKRGQFLLQAGEACLYEYFVLNGVVRAFYVNEQGEEHTTFFSTEGWWTGNLKSFVKGTPSSFFLQLMESTEIIRLNKASIEKLYEDVPKLERYFRILLQNRLISVQDRVSGHLSFTAEERYINFRKKYPNLEQRISQKYIASYLGITPAYLSRLRKRMSEF